jgi:hypothetical protein
VNNIAPLCDMLGAFRNRGITCKVSATGTLQVRPPGLLTASDRGWLGKNAGAMVDLLRAIDDIHATDGVVAASGISGTHPEIQKATEVVTAAYGAGDLTRTHAACAEMRSLVERIVALNRLESNLTHRP